MGSEPWTLKNLKPFLSIPSAQALFRHSFLGKKVNTDCNRQSTILTSERKLFADERLYYLRTLERNVVANLLSTN